MKLTITGKKFTVTDTISEKITEKLSKLDKYFDQEATGTVMLRSRNRKNTEIIEITIFYKGTVFRAEEEDETALNALDRAVDVIERQIRKNKTRLEKRLKKGAFDKVAMADKQWEDVKEEPITIARTKQFVLKPMSPEEAALQMDLLGHEFYLFIHEDTQAVCVVYRRKDKEFGVIEAITE